MAPVEIVDIIVPVYLGIDATRRCLASILEASVTTRYELIVVNDASPEPELVREIRERSRARRSLCLSAARMPGRRRRFRRFTAWQ